MIIYLYIKQHSVTGLKYSVSIQEFNSNPDYVGISSNIAQDILRNI